MILLHGPVGSAKSTIARLLKKGLQAYSRTDEGSLYAYQWIGLGDVLGMEDTMPCPMHEEPLHVIPMERRRAVLDILNKNRDRAEAVHIEGDLCPACRFVYNKLMERYNGDWEKLVSKHIEVAASSSRNRIASASARSSRRTRRTRIQPN